MNVSNNFDRAGIIRLDDAINDDFGDVTRRLLRSTSIIFSRLLQQGVLRTHSYPDLHWSLAIMGRVSQKNNIEITI